MQDCYLRMNVKVFILTSQINIVIIYWQISQIR
uniref:Uncharacterized protein n=1 Tax=Podoviridae sp. ctZkC8 TaxID=2825259 RepID=A0A8S5UC31_9CAUD|nr:MAG TPA: hypothetical protein [Podoviridae sp. ctZkC8]